MGMLGRRFSKGMFSGRTVACRDALYLLLGRSKNAPATSYTVVFLPGTVTLPKAYASQVMQSAIKRQRTMTKARTALVILGDGQVLLRSRDS